MTVVNVPVNRRFGMLTVVGLGEGRERVKRGHHRDGSERIRVVTEYTWRVRCDCGNERDVWPTNLLAGRSTSCGCKPYSPRRPGSYRRPPTFTVDQLLALPEGLTRSDQRAALGCSESTLTRLRRAAREARS